MSDRPVTVAEFDVVVKDLIDLIERGKNSSHTVERQGVKWVVLTYDGILVSSYWREINALRMANRLNGGMSG